MFRYLLFLSFFSFVYGADPRAYGRHNGWGIEEGIGDNNSIARIKTDGEVKTPDLSQERQISADMHDEALRNNIATGSDSSNDSVSAVEVATRRFSMHGDIPSHVVRPYIVQVIEEDKGSPVSDPDIMRRVSSGVFLVRCAEDRDYIHDVLIRASHHAIADQHRTIESKWSKKQAAFLAAGTSLMSTIITATVSLLTK